MAKIELRDYQKEAVRKAVEVPHNLICIQTGKGKSLVGVFYARALIKNKLADKVIFASTKTGVGSFKKAFTKRVGVNINQYDDPCDFMNFLISDEKVCIIKHSMFEKLGFEVCPAPDAKRTDIIQAIKINDEEKKYIIETIVDVEIHRYKYKK